MNAAEVKQIIISLHKIANELGLEFTSPQVVVEFSKRHGGVSSEIMDNLLHPIYFPNGTYHAVKLEGDKVIALQKEKQGEWIKVEG